MSTASLPIPDVQDGLVYRFCRLGLAFTYRGVTGIKRTGADFTVHARLPEAWPSFLLLISMAKAIIRLVSHAAIRISRDTGWCSPP